MPLKPNQRKTGHLAEESVNDTNRTGRDDGFGPNQPTSGHKSERDFPTGPNVEKRGGRPFIASNRGEDLPRLPEKTIERLDSVTEIDGG